MVILYDKKHKKVLSYMPDFIFWSEYHSDFLGDIFSELDIEIIFAEEMNEDIMI